MALLKGTVNHPNGTFTLTLDTETGEEHHDPFFDRWFQPEAMLPNDVNPIDRRAEPERWLRALRVQFRHHPLVIEEVRA